MLLTGAAVGLEHLLRCAEGSASAFIKALWDAVQSRIPHGYVEGHAPGPPVDDLFAPVGRLEVAQAEVQERAASSEVRSAKTVRDWARLYRARLGLVLVAARTLREAYESRDAVRFDPAKRGLRAAIDGLVELQNAHLVSVLTRQPLAVPEPD